jgi:hypothetical protein
MRGRFQGTSSGNGKMIRWFPKSDDPDLDQHYSAASEIHLILKIFFAFEKSSLAEAY